MINETIDFFLYYRDIAVIKQKYEQRNTYDNILTLITRTCVENARNIAINKEKIVSLVEKGNYAMTQAQTKKLCKIK